jgi:hypothetical protein
MLGNDAHYTLIAFEKMCITSSKSTSIMEQNPVRFSIRDLVPDDLIIKNR